MRKPGDLIEKDPSADEPHGFDWTKWLTELGAGVVIQSATWTITGPDSTLTSHDPTLVAGALKSQAYFAGGTNGALYTVVNHIVTNSSPPVTDERSFQVLVQNR